MSNIMNNIGGNISYAKETNFSLLNTDTDIWEGELPYKPGSEFPTTSIKERANKLKTARLLFYNDSESIFESLINIFPEIDPTTGWQIREIVANLPQFKNCINSWVGVLVGKMPIIDCRNNQYDLVVSKVLDSSNLTEFVLTEATNLFLEDTSVYKISESLSGKPHISYIDSKNVVLFVNKNNIDEVEVVVVFNINNTENKVEFIEYHYDGIIVKRVFDYYDGKIGDEHINEFESEMWLESKKTSPIIVFTHNKIGNNVYGRSVLEDWSTSIVTAERELQNVFRLGERLREVIRKVPESSIKRDSVTGGSMFFNRGTVSYPDGIENTPDIAYVVPDVPIDKALNAFERAIKNISIDTKLGSVFFDIEKMGSNLSAKSIEAALYPTKIEALRIQNSVKTYMVETVLKLCLSCGVDLEQSDINFEWSDSFPKDIKEFTEAIMLRLNSRIPTISMSDAIMKLDGVSNRVAIQKANEILNIKNESKVENFEATNIANNSVTNEVDNQDSTASVESNNDDTVWESQMYPPPVTLESKGLNKEVDQWYLRKLRVNH
jgi:hypothetical protein